MNQVREKLANESLLSFSSKLSKSLLPLASFDVSVESMTSHPVRVNELPEEGYTDGKLYFVSDLDLGDKAVAALALECRDCRINTMIFPPSLHPVAKVAP